MKRAKYLFVLICGTLVYVILSLTVGQNSLSCYNQMEEQKRIISTQKAEIQNINSELSLELTAIKNDKAVIAAYARKLDYVADGEKIIKITGLKPAKTSLYETGSVVRHVEPEYVSERLCKIAGLCAGLLVLLLFVINDVKSYENEKNKRPAINGIPIYDIPQI